MALIDLKWIQIMPICIIWPKLPKLTNIGLNGHNLTKKDKGWPKLTKMTKNDKINRN